MYNSSFLKPVHTIWHKFSQSFIYSFNKSLMCLPNFLPSRCLEHSIEQRDQIFALLGFIELTQYLQPQFLFL